MTARVHDFGWQWRADRSLDQRAAVRLVSVERESGGLFGLGRSPSLGGALPDPRRVEAVVVAVDRPGTLATGERLRFRLPALELGDAAPGALMVIGIIGTMVVCLAPVPTAIPEEGLADWLPEAPCG